MKLFAALLAASTIAVVAPATAQASLFSDNSIDNSGDNRGNDYSGKNRNNGGIIGDNNRVNTGPVTRNVDRSNNAEGGTGVGLGVGIAGANAEGGSSTIEEGAIDNRNSNRNKNTNTAEGGKAVQGQAQGQGQQQGIDRSGNSSSASGAVAGSAARGGDQSQTSNSSATGGSSDQSQSSSNTNTSQSNNSNRTSSRSSSNNNGNNQSLNYTNIDIPEATVAPLPENGVPGQIGDVVIPLPSIRGGVFTTRDNDIFYGGDRSTTGATIGFQIPLGTGQVVAAAEQIVARRESAARFQLIREATWMLQQGVLDADAHPEHWAALYGAPPVASVF